MRSRYLVAFGLALLGTAPIVATHAQLLNPFPFSRNARHDLSQSDIAKVMDLSNQINAAPGSKAPKNWSNPETGNSGTVAFVKSFQSDAMPCNTLRYSFSVKHRPRHRTYLMNWCQTPDGAWKTKG